MNKLRRTYRLLWLLNCWLILLPNVASAYIYKEPATFKNTIIILLIAAPIFALLLVFRLQRVRHHRANLKLLNNLKEQVPIFGPEIIKSRVKTIIEGIAQSRDMGDCLTNEFQRKCSDDPSILGDYATISYGIIFSFEHGADRQQQVVVVVDYTKKSWDSNSRWKNVKREEAWTLIACNGDWLLAGIKEHEISEYFQL